MFYKLVARNSKRSRKENGLFFSSLLISIIAFYIILSLSQQDVMYFLRKMESDAVNKLLTIIPAFFCVTLVILFFLIYYASKYQLERRQHEFAMYLIMGMRRSRLFALLMAEDFSNNIIVLSIGLPTAILLSEIISLVTSRVVGLGIIGHHFSFSSYALIITLAGFLAIKLVSFLILSGKICRLEIGTLMTGVPEGSKKQLPTSVYVAALIAGFVSLVIAYYLGITGISWRNISKMAVTLFLGFTGTLLMFYGMRIIMLLLIKREKYERPLRIFNFRQIQESVIHKSGSMAISSILILAGLSCFGTGISYTNLFDDSKMHIMDYTFINYDEDYKCLGINDVNNKLEAAEIDKMFSDLFEMKIGHINTTDNHENVFKMDTVTDSVSKFPDSEEKDTLINNLSFADYPHLISLSGYNHLLELAGLPTLKLASNEAAVYIDNEFITAQGRKIFNQILKDKPEAFIDGNPIYLAETVQTTGLVTDRSITLSFALILPDDVFEYYTQNDFDIYVNGVLDSKITNEAGLMGAISKTNEKLNDTGLDYESYLQNIGRRLFYSVAASYITIYLGVIFMIVANTVIGIQFLMHQQRTNRRYKTLIRLGATYESLCQSAKKQINWHFWIPTTVAAINSIFATRSLIPALLSSGAEDNLSVLMIISGAMILLLCVIECIYIMAVKHSSNNYLLSLMVPEREE